MEKITKEEDLELPEGVVEDTHLIHLEDGLKHTLSEECWCDPTLESEDASGARVYKHKQRN